MQTNDEDTAFLFMYRLSYGGQKDNQILSNMPKLQLGWRQNSISALTLLIAA